VLADILTMEYYMLGHIESNMEMEAQQIIDTFKVSIY